jgi:replication initiation and membrane attachment protein
MKDNNLQKKVLDYYRNHKHFDKIEEILMNITQTQPRELCEFINKEPTTKEEQLIKQLEEFSPVELLYDLNGRVEPKATDLITISNIMKYQKLNAGVVNVLIYFVMLIANMKLPKAYMEKIASRWARKQVKTVREAMEMAKQETKRYREWQNEKIKFEKHNWNTFVDEMKQKGYTPEELLKIVELYEQGKIK